MHDLGYEPLLDSKWAVPFVTVLIILIATILTLLRIGMFVFGRGRNTRVKSPPARPALIDVSVTTPLRPEHP